MIIKIISMITILQALISKKKIPGRKFHGIFLLFMIIKDLLYCTADVIPD